MERPDHESRRRGAPAARSCRVAFAALLLAALGSAASAADPDEIERLRREISALRSEYESRMSDLERRLARLEAGAPTAPPQSEPEADLEALRAAAREAAASEPAAAETGAVAIGRERNLNRLNPEISFTGIFVANASDVEREEFHVEAFELDFQSTLDPFSRTRVVLGVHEGEAEIEEAWVNYSSLPGSLDLLAGRFRQRFGAVNRQHLHALPQSSYPLAHQTYFGEEGLAQSGLSFTWLLPRPWASANEITFEVTDGENEEAFGGETFEDFAVLGRLKNFWQISDASFFEWGLSGISGETAAGGDSRVWGTDFTFNWQPPDRAKYRGVTWRTELLLSQRDDDLVRRQEALGVYSYVEALVRRGLWGGLRLDHVEDPVDPEVVRWGLTPYFTWWQSEYVRLRGEYGYLKDDATGEEENRFTLQLTWAAGPHKHESY